MSDDNNVEVARSLGRIEGTQDQILAEFKILREQFATHVISDDKNFSAMKQDANRAKGAGWVILSLLGALATFVGGSVVAVLAGWIHVHWL